MSTRKSLTLGAGFCLSTVVISILTLPGCGGRSSSSLSTGGSGGVGVPPSFLVFTANANGGVSAFVATGTGTLAQVSSSPFTAGTSPFAVASDPSGKFLFVANFSSGDVSAYTISSSDGALIPVIGSPFTAGTAPLSIAVDPSGKFVFVGNQNSNNVSAFAVGANGTLTQVVGSPFATDVVPRSVAVDRSGKYLYVATGAGTISAFSIDSTSGVLSVVTGSPFATDPSITSLKASPVAAACPCSWLTAVHRRRLRTFLA